MPVIRNEAALVLIAVSSILACPALAANEDIIALCAESASSAERIQCLEDVLRRAQRVQEVDPDPVPVVIMPVPRASGPELAPPTEPVEQVESAATAPVTQVAESIPPEVTPEIQDNETVEDNSTQELGADQIAPGKKLGRNAERIQAIIVSFDTVGIRQLRFRLDNGQVWRQVGDDDQNIGRKIRNKKNIPVEMWQSRTGGYRLRILSIGRTVRVKRLK